ncbi:beta-glucan synthesis-associated protein KRE6, partial [Tremellales sp. Uapishka_1]
MAPKYPFARSHPSSSSTSTTTTTTTTERPVVVSASGRAPPSPAAGLTADSPSTLRSRIVSPRNPAVADVFQNDTSSYPSPSALLKGKAKRKKTKSEANGGWIPLSTASPPVQVPRYDARGYPTKDFDSPESSKSIRFENQTPLRRSNSQLSMASSVSSTGAGVGDERDRRFLSAERPTSYYAPIDGATPNTLYPPTLNYGLSAPSYSPYGDPSPDANHAYGVMPNAQPVPSLYGDSRVSLVSQTSDHSMTHFRKHDALKDEYAKFSISSKGGKGGKRHLGDMFSLPADPSTWSSIGPEADDDFHDPDFKDKGHTRFFGAMLTVRGASNIGCLLLMVILLVALFCVYPILSQTLEKTSSTLGAYNLGGINSTGQIPSITGLRTLIDADTPTSAYTHTSLETGDEWELVFSDEFNTDGRTFYDGDDPYWIAEDMHYWSTNNLEWYDPRSIITKGGALTITLNKTRVHDLNYQGGMMNTWNRFCFTGGYVEAAVSLPGTHTVYGLWPAIWAMGNLGRAGYGGTLEGMWPYNYDSCDVGTLSNQTLNGLPAVALTEGDSSYDGILSYLPGQRLSRCTCSSDTTHPGPKHDDGTWVGRGAPEIDMFEALVTTDTQIGQVSQSGQWAPFNPYYKFINNSKTYEIYNDSITALNGYSGGIYQQATSAISTTDQNCYTGPDETGCFSIYGFEYSPGDSGYITWVNNAQKAWTIRGGAMAANKATEVSQRQVTEEPMYLIMNLGLSENFGAIDYDGLASLWPVTMAVDYIRVYQDPNNKNIGCDPAAFPTAAYIAQYPDAYANPNITTFAQIPNSIKPKNNLTDTC